MSEPGGLQMLHQPTSAIPAASAEQALSIAAIIPLYNGAKFIEQAIGSVLSQTLLPDEIIVIDDGSTDDGPALVERMAEKHPITLLRQPTAASHRRATSGLAIHQATCSPSSIKTTLGTRAIWKC